MEEIKEVKFAPGLTADILFVELQSQGREYLRLMSYYSSAMLEMELWRLSLIKALKALKRVSKSREAFMKR